VAAIKTTARKDGDDYVINGTKMWITNSTQADFFCLLANTSDGKPHLNKSLIVVPTKTQGHFPLRKKLNKLGMRSSDTAQIFRQVRVPQRYRDRRRRHGLHDADDAVPGRAHVRRRQRRGRHGSLH
jgi:citronellyl-CoA dehydrogenase